MTWNASQRRTWPDVNLEPRETAHVIQAALLGVQRNNVSVRPLLAIENTSQIAALTELITSGLVTTENPS